MSNYLLNTYTLYHIYSAIVLHHSSHLNMYPSILLCDNYQRWRPLTWWFLNYSISFHLHHDFLKISLWYSIWFLLNGCVVCCPDLMVNLIGPPWRVLRDCPKSLYKTDCSSALMSSDRCVQNWISPIMIPFDSFSILNDCIHLTRSLLSSYEMIHMTDLLAIAFIWHLNFMVTFPVFFTIQYSPCHIATKFLGPLGNSSNTLSPALNSISLFHGDLPCLLYNTIRSLPLSHKVLGATR